MSTRYICDRCARDMGAEPDAEISVVFGDEDSEERDLCGACYDLLMQFLRGLTPKKRRKK